MKSPGQRRGDGGGRGFHSEMAREGALAHLPSQYGHEVNRLPWHVIRVLTENVRSLAKDTWRHAKRVREAAMGNAELERKFQHRT